jgi:uncharacterized phage-like protein YoqJ
VGKDQPKETEAMKICATGHRPKSLGVPNPYSPETFARLVATAGAWFDQNPEVSEVITGMALGWDQAVAVAAINRMLPVHCYLPFPGQADSWPIESHTFYQKLLRQCDSHRTISRGPYHPGMMQKRNEAMVDDAELVLCLWNGEPGGTANCVAYAMKRMVPVENLWDLFCL